MKEINEVKSRIKNKQYNKNNKTNINKFKIFVLKLFIVIILFLGAEVYIKKDSKIKNNIYQKVYNSSFSFSSIKQLYNSHIGNVLPFQNIVTTKKVFSEKLSYKSLAKYNKGVKLTLTDNYLIPAIKGGIVIFEGVKDGKNTVIVQQPNKIDVWYSNLSNTNVKLYDYIEDNQIIGEAKDNTLYLSFQKDGVEIDYKEVIK